MATRIEYREYIQKTREERIAIFNAVSPDERAELMRTHLTLWLDANRGDLALTQVAAIERVIALVTPALYTDPKNERQIRRFIRETQRAAAILTAEQAISALWIVPSTPSSPS